MKLFFSFLATLFFAQPFANAAEDIQVRVLEQPLRAEERMRLRPPGFSARVYGIVPPAAFVSCYAEDEFGRSYEASGSNNPGFVQQVALQACYNQSPAPNTCRAVGCQ